MNPDIYMLQYHLMYICLRVLIISISQEALSSFAADSNCSNKVLQTSISFDDRNWSDKPKRFTVLRLSKMSTIVMQSADGKFTKAPKISPSKPQLTSTLNILANAEPPMFTRYLYCASFSLQYLLQSRANS